MPRLHPPVAKPPAPPAKPKAAKKPKAEPKNYASKSAHDKLRTEFDEFKARVGGALGLDPNA